jgi:hypothetical protein
VAIAGFKTGKRVSDSTTHRKKETKYKSSNVARYLNLTSLTLTTHMSLSIDSNLDSYTHDLSSHRYIKGQVFSKPMTIQFIFPLSSVCGSAETSVNTKHLPNCKALGSHISVYVDSGFFEGNLSNWPT